MRTDRTKADDIVQGAYNRALLDLILPAMRTVAFDYGYAITVHGSLDRDIDLVAIAWRERDVSSKEELLEGLVGAIRSVTGRAAKGYEWSNKPHGRFAAIIMTYCGEATANIDLSVIPPKSEN